MQHADEGEEASGGVVVDELLHPGSAGVDRGSIIASILIVSTLTVLYTVLGGIEAVIWTDVLQVLVLGGGAIIALIIIAGDIGPSRWQGLQHHHIDYGNSRTFPNFAVDAASPPG